MTSGGRELLKWIALVLMTGDHIDKALLGGSAPWLSDAGRVVFPIFAFVLAWNLTTAGQGARDRAVSRLLLAGLLLWPLHAIAFGHWLPAPILWTLALGVMVADPRWPIWQRVLAFVVVSLFLDYQWAGVLLVASCFWIVRHAGQRNAWALLALALLPLCVFNGNGWALLALPLLWYFGIWPGVVPRHRWTFLGYYAGHLAVLAAFAGHVLPAIG